MSSISINDSSSKITTFQPQNPSENEHVLCIVPSVSVWKKGNDLVFDKKFFDGICEYTRYWEGRVSVVVRLSNDKLPDFGKVYIHPSDLKFRCTILSYQEPFQASHFLGATIVLAAGDANDQFCLAAITRNAAIKLVYILENIPQTRYQIALLSSQNPLVILRRIFYIWKQERYRLNAFFLADGFQFNGLPAANYYNQFSHSVLYFDTRVRADQFISDATLNKRLLFLREKRPLRLAFSGRLNKMKGADHLVLLASLLKNLKIRFQMTIYGSGDLDNKLAVEVENRGLNDSVNFRGAVDFDLVLLPELASSCDLFIILHRQSDPSCTYLETLACGVPLLGYKNLAYQGLLERAEVGWGVPSDDLMAVAEQIAHLDQNRDALANVARTGLAFARENNFENTMKSRITHLRGIINT